MHILPEQRFQLDVFYGVKSPAVSLFLVIAIGREGLVEWKEDPLFPNSTLYWNTIIYGSSSITQKISHSFTYYVAVDNVNLQNVEVESSFSLNAILYNSTSTSHRCSLDGSLCALNIVQLESNTAILTTPGSREGVSNEEWFDVNVSYEPRWIIYFTTSAVVAVLILVAVKIFKMFQTNDEEREGFQHVEVVSEQAPLLPSKDDDDFSSRGSSNASFSNEEEDHTKWLGGNSSMAGKSSRGEETSNDLQHLGVICFDAQRDCFFLPCGHSAACFACGTRSEINIRPWQEEFLDIKRGSQAVSWKSRLPQAYWKGNPDVASPIRAELLNCNHSRKWGAQIMRQDWGEAARSGFKQSKLSDQCNHRYKIYAEGYAWSVSLKYILSCGSVALIISPQYEDFFSRGLIPNHNFWLVDPLNLCPSIKYAVEWGNQHPVEAEAIGKRGQDFMESLNMDRVYEYMFHLISEYSKLQDFKPTPPSTSLEVCVDSVLCFADEKQRMFLSKSTTFPSRKPPCNLKPA